MTSIRRPSVPLVGLVAVCSLVACGGFTAPAEQARPATGTSDRAALNDQDQAIASALNAVADEVMVLESAIAALLTRTRVADASPNPASQERSPADRAFDTAGDLVVGVFDAFAEAFDPSLVDAVTDAVDDGVDALAATGALDDVTPLVAEGREAIAAAARSAATDLPGSGLDPVVAGRAASLLGRLADTLDDPQEDLVDALAAFQAVNIATAAAALRAQYAPLLGYVDLLRTHQAPLAPALADGLTVELAAAVTLLDGPVSVRDLRAVLDVFAAARDSASGYLLR